MIERRRSVRVSVDGDPAPAPGSFEVRVIDLTSAGVLLRSSQPLDIGVRGQLSITLRDEALDAAIEVRRVAPAAGVGATQFYDIGAVFVALSVADRYLIERFATQ